MKLLTAAVFAGTLLLSVSSFSLAETSSETMQPLESYTGDVIAVKDVTLEATTIAGGSLIAGKTTTRQNATGEGIELTIKLEDGQKLAVVQDKDDEYAPGDEVRVFHDASGAYRVRQ